MAKWKRLSPVRESGSFMCSVCSSTVLLEDNSPEISRVTGSSCSVSSTSRLYVLLILTPGSTNIKSVFTNLDTPMHERRQWSTCWKSNVSTSEVAQGKYTVEWGVYKVLLVFRDYYTIKVRWETNILQFIKQFVAEFEVQEFYCAMLSIARTVLIIIIISLYWNQVDKPQLATMTHQTSCHAGQHYTV